MAKSSFKSFLGKIFLWILGIYILILFVWGFLSNCIIGREEPTIGQCTSNQLNMAVTLGFNEMVQYFQSKAEKRGERLTNMLEDLASGSGVVKVSNSSGGLDLEVK